MLDDTVFIHLKTVGPLARNSADFILGQQPIVWMQAERIMNDSAVNFRAEGAERLQFRAEGPGIPADKRPANVFRTIGVSSAFPAWTV